jgi:hypothetical protein
MISALPGVAYGPVVSLVPTAVQPTRHSYPYTPAGYVVAAIVFALNHALLLVAMVGLGQSGALGNRAFGRVGVWMSVAGWGVLTLCEIDSITLANATEAAAKADPLAAGYGLGTILTGVGLILAGVAVARQGAFTGWARYVTLACGIAVFGIVVPGLMGPFVLGRLAIAVWMLLLAALGLALVRSERTGMPLT